MGVASETKSVVVFTGLDTQVDDTRAVLGFVESSVDTTSVLVSL